MCTFTHGNHPIDGGGPGNNLFVDGTFLVKPDFVVIGGTDSSVPQGYLSESFSALRGVDIAVTAANTSPHRPDFAPGPRL